MCLCGFVCGKTQNVNECTLTFYRSRARAQQPAAPVFPRPLSSTVARRSPGRRREAGAVLVFVCSEYEMCRCCPSRLPHPRGQRAGHRQPDRATGPLSAVGLHRGVQHARLLRTRAGGYDWPNHESARDRCTRKTMHEINLGTCFDTAV